MTVNTLASDAAADCELETAGELRSAGELETAGEARQAVICGLQRVLEVLEGRRPAEHLTKLLNIDVYEQVEARRRRGRAAKSLDPDHARVVRLHLQLKRRGAGSVCADYFGTVLRGERFVAVAGRIEQLAVPVPSRGGPRRCENRWVITELVLV